MRTVTAIVGSARKKGLTAAATRQLLDELQAFGDVRTELVFLSDCKLGVCRGCKTCFERDEALCPLRDDRDLLFEKMTASDGVVFASPVYSFHVSGQMKIFLDRLGFVFHRPRFHGKAFTSVAIQAFFGGDDVVKYLGLVGGGIGGDVVKGACITGVEPQGQRDRRKMNEALAALAARFHARLSSPAPAPSLFRLWAFRWGRTAVARLSDPHGPDYAYYRDRGWLESDYFYETRLGPVKRAAGATFDWFAARSVKQRVD
jgi:multimeric flavodoxin WrbA